MTVNELAIAAKADKMYLTELWLSVRKLIVFWAIPYCKSNKSTNRYELDDLIQSAYFALLRAVDDYTADCEYKFSTYLFNHCRNEFRSVLGIRTSKREPEALSLDEPLAAGMDVALSDTVPDERAAAEFDNVIEDIYTEQLHNALSEALQALPALNRQVIELRYYKRLRYDETAAALNLTGSDEARRIEYRAFRALRRGKVYARLKEFDYYSYGIKRTGFLSFKYSMESSVERAVMKKLDIESQCNYSQRFIGKNEE